jgi:hypothetical protein
VVLAGASSLVVMQPAAARHSELIGRIWTQVAHAEDAASLVQTLTAIGLSQMPSLGVFFWTGDRMTSLARGGVVVKDATSGRVVNHGDGVLTWREAGLDPSIVTVEMEDAPERLVMPLLLGVVQASRLTIDATGTVEPLVVGDQQDPASAPSAVSSAGYGDSFGGAEVGGGSFGGVGDGGPAWPAAVDAPPSSQDSAGVFADVDDLGLAPATSPVSAPSAPSAASASSAASPVPAPSSIPAAPPITGNPWTSAPSVPNDDLDWGSTWPADDSADPWTRPSRLADEDAGGAQPAAQAGGSSPSSSSSPSRSGWGDSETSMAHDGATMFMPGLANEAPDSGPEGSGLVTAALCTAGHANPPGALHCRICSAPMDPAGPRLVDRPCLGVLVASSGESIDLLGPVLVGRAPNGGSTDPQAALLRVLSPNQDISRTHVRVAPSDWSIEVTDMNSTNGTLVRHPGGEAIRLSPGETVTVEIGAVIDLGDDVSLEIAPPRG